MQGSGLKNRAEKEAFYRGLLRTARALDAGALDAKAADLARRTRRIWLADASLRAEIAAARDEPARGSASRSGGAPAALAPLPAEEAPAFDPFAFSAVVVMSRQGRAGLMQKLGEITDPDQLKQIADAQHLAIDRSLTGLDALREAIVKGAEQRIADRRAAAS